MIKRGEELRLTFETRQPVGVGRKRSGQHLQRDVATQLQVASAIHLAHATCPERSDDFVWA